MSKFKSKCFILCICKSLKANQNYSSLVISESPLYRFLCVVQVCISGEWQSWQGKVPQIEVETHKVASPDVVVPTLDTVRHEALLYTWLAEHKPLVLCGPPGSGKTMTLFSALRALPDMEVRAWMKEFQN